MERSFDLTEIHRIPLLTVRIRDPVCSTPGGLHFSKIAVWCFNEASESTTDLMSRCSDTLESLEILYSVPSMFCILTTFPFTSTNRQLVNTLSPLVDAGTSRTPSPLDLSKLKHLVFQYGVPSIRWITMALQTAKSENLQTITIRPVVTTSEHPIAVTLHKGRQGLDRLLIKFWTSRSIRPKVV